MKFNYPKNVYESDVKPIQLHVEYNYKLDVDEFGNDVVVVDNVRDVQAEINSFADEANIYKILERHLAGDSTALQQHTGMYITKEMAEAANDFVNGLTADESLRNAYTKYGTDKISYDKFSELVKDGKWSELLDIANGTNTTTDGGQE